MQDDFTIEMVTWQSHSRQLEMIREQVFMLEQQVPAELEWDGLDETAQHLLALNKAGDAIGCARMTGDGSIGRMAVLRPWRNMGVGTALLNAAIAYYRQRAVQTVKLSAQLHAVGFYEKEGFELCSEPYLDANILHVDMRLK